MYDGTLQTGCLIWLVVSTHLKNMKVNGKDYLQYIMENKSHVWNHQPVMLWLSSFEERWISHAHQMQLEMQQLHVDTWQSATTRRAGSNKKTSELIRHLRKSYAEATMAIHYTNIYIYICIYMVFI